jgi:hypothetical protein
MRIRRTTLNSQPLNSPSQFPIRLLFDCIYYKKGWKQATAATVFTVKPLLTCPLPIRMNSSSNYRHVMLSPVQRYFIAALPSNKYLTFLL